MFKIGDEVIVKEGVNAYIVTTPGSRGFIVSINPRIFKVKFIGSTLEHQAEGFPTFIFDSGELVNFSLVNEEKLPEKDMKYEKIIKKIRQLDTKFAERNSNVPSF